MPLFRLRGRISPQFHLKNQKNGYEKIDLYFGHRFFVLRNGMFQKQRRNRCGPSYRAEHCFAGNYLRYQPGTSRYHSARHCGATHHPGRDGRLKPGPRTTRPSVRYSGGRAFELASRGNRQFRRNVYSCGKACGLTSDSGVASWSAGGYCPGHEPAPRAARA